MLREDVIFFLKINPNPTDDVVHAWAESQGYDTHKVEAEIYKLATKFVMFLVNGTANEKGISEEDVDKDELKAGIEVEKEHTPDEDVAKRIALDHLAELPDYYTRLKKMESE